MAIEKELFDLLYSLRSNLKGKKIVSLGNPYLSKVNLYKYFQVDLLEIKSIQINELSKYVFEKYFEVKTFKIIDINGDENADLIHNLNFEIIQHDLINQFDFVIDPGTSEHIFNQEENLSNIFKLLKNNGMYLFSLPANSWIDHGFRQYSPTYFYDMCAANNGKLMLSALGLSCFWINLDCVPLYKRYDKKFEEVFDSEIYSKVQIFNNFGFKTGLMMRLINKLGSPTMVNGIIKKLDNNIDFINVNQFIYRIYNLDQVTSNQKRRLNKSNILKFIKEFIFIFPIPTILKIYILRIL
ncbi:class I SAM-dependent methyltransferase [Prochlorococcus sp. AH-716-D22]|nr:class I SAM-dependent methyltransferase [Prochlorococcus sp. AH-716-D22]